MQFPRGRTPAGAERQVHQAQAPLGRTMAAAQQQQPPLQQQQQQPVSRSCWPSGAAGGCGGGSARPSPCPWSGPGTGPIGRLVDSVSSKLAFYPPTPSSYAILTHNDGTGQLYVQPRERGYPRVPNALVEWVDVPRRREGGGGTGRVPTAFLAFRDAAGRRARCTLLYSHGNAVDLGQMLPVFRDLSRLLRVNLMAYDYTGYGPDPSGSPSVSNALADVAAVYKHMLERHSVRPEDVVLYGQSVGSGPTSWLAVQEPGVAGVVLHSPLYSGVRVLQPNMKFWPGWLDIFPNHLLVPRITAPLLVLHGTADEVIHVSAGERLAALAPNGVPPLLAEGFDHQNVECSPEYLPRMKEFLSRIFPEDYPLSSFRR